jgi:hypothetical protein
METRAEFLRSLGEDLARYRPERVARLGCFTGLGLAAAGVVAGLSGTPLLREWTDPIFPDFIRLIVLSILGGVLVVFLVFSALEGAAEKRASARLREYLSKGQADPEILLEMARVRQGRFPGSDRVIALLERDLSRGRVPPAS